MAIVEKAWAHYDFDNSNSFDRDETKAFLSYILKELELPDSMLDSFIESYDKDENGKLTKAEVTKLISDLMNN